MEIHKETKKSYRLAKVNATISQLIEIGIHEMDIIGKELKVFDIDKYWNGCYNCSTIIYGQETKFGFFHWDYIIPTKWLDFIS